MTENENQGSNDTVENTANTLKEGAQSTGNYLQNLAQDVTQNDENNRGNSNKQNQQNSE